MYGEDTRETFLDALENKCCGYIAWAARLTGVAPKTVYAWRNQDPEFAAQWDEAQRRGEAKRAAAIEAPSAQIVIEGGEIVPIYRKDWDWIETKGNDPTDHAAMKEGPNVIGYKWVPADPKLVMLFLKAYCGPRFQTARVNIEVGSQVAPEQWVEGVVDRIIDIAKAHGQYIDREAATLRLVAMVSAQDADEDAKPN